MPNYLYNGVELPELPSWDKTTYPFAFIRKTESGANELYVLHVYSSRPYYWISTFETFHVSADNVSYMQSKYYPTEDEVWGAFDENSYASKSTSLAKEVIWTNTDILNNEDGTVWLAASDPVLVEDETPETVLALTASDLYKKVNGQLVKHTLYKKVGGELVKYDEYLMRAVEKTAEPIPDGCLTFSSAEPFTIGVYNSTKNWDGTLYYSTDKTTWSEWDGTEAVTSAEHGAEQRLYMRGSNNSIICGNNSNSYRWLITGVNIHCEGNIETLLDYETVLNGDHPTMGEYCYSNMFRDCKSLISAPELPATTLASYCYANMFRNCRSLISAPELPATTLADECYFAMFCMCTSLTTAPELPATTLADSCYSSMFSGCSSLVTAPELPATTLADECYFGMFSLCTSLTTAPELPATTLAEKCYVDMFYLCKSLVTVPALPATTLADGCYSYMFYDCKNIKLSTTQTDEYQTPYRVPISGMGTTASNSLSDMFGITGGTFKGTPEINTTYYTANEVV